MCFSPEPRAHASAAGAFTRIELIALGAVVLLLLACLVVPARARHRARSQRIACTGNLKHFALARITWELDRDTGLIQIEKARASQLQALTNGEVFRYFQTFSNEFGGLGWTQPRVLVCPADTRKPGPAFGAGLSNSNISYFVGMDADHAEMFLAGDRNITNGLAPVNGLLVLSPARAAGWTHQIHHRQGNIALADGSVQHFSSSRLNADTNRIVIP